MSVVAKVIIRELNYLYPALERGQQMITSSTETIMGIFRRVSFNWIPRHAMVVNLSLRLPDS